ncbi:MAG: ThuA domain-containing protein [Acidimicrobiia bacterium]
MSKNCRYATISTHRKVGCGIVAVLLFACTGTSGATSTIAAAAATSSTTSTLQPTSTSVAGGFDVLVFHRTEGFRHASIEAGIAAIERLSEEHGFSVVAGQDPTVFSEAGLAPFEVIVFLSTTGDVLDPEEERAMEAFVDSGGGFVGVHAAADTEYDWAWYGDLVGAYFDSHPEPQQAVLQVAAAGHPIVADIPATFERFDEWYNFRTLPGEDITLLVTIDETSYQGGTMGQPHPISWAQETLGGRSFYTAMGHTEESFTDPLVLTHLGNGILWAAGPA